MFYVESALVGQGIVIRIRKFLVQTPLGTWPGIEAQHRYKASGDLQGKNVKMQ